MHYHLSLWDADESENLFASDTGDMQFPAGKHPQGDAGLSDVGRHFIGGLLDHMKALTAICAPTVNSYKRLLPGIWAPVNIAWGPDNRSTILRLPPELGPATRSNTGCPIRRVTRTSASLRRWRPDSTGSETRPIRGADAPERLRRDYEMLPRTLWAAVDHLEDDDVLVDARWGRRWSRSSSN